MQDTAGIAGELVEVEDEQPVRAEHLEPVRQEVGVATPADREVALVGGVQEVQVGERVDVGEVLLDRELRRDPQAGLLVLEERDRAGDRLAQHDDDPRRSGASRR